MEIDPSSFFKNLVANTKDLKRGPSECLRILELLNRNLIEEQINSSFIDLFLIHIFEKSNGLIKFLDSTIKIKEFKNAVIKAVEILYTLVNNFPSRLVESNIVDIYIICNTAIKLHTLSDVKVKALELLLVSLEKLDVCFETNDISTTYKEILNSLQNALKQKHCDSVKHKELMVLGYFAKRYQYLISNPKELQVLFVRNLDPEIFKPKKSQHIICGFFIGFSCFCESFPLDLAKNEDKKLIDKLYKLMHNLVVPTDKIKTGNRAALEFLTNNVGIFGEFLLKDYKYWHTKLLNWLEMGAEERKAGAKVLRTVCQEIATLLCNKTQGDWINVVKYFNQWSLDVLKKSDVSNHEKHLSIQCLKFFSSASYKYLPQKDVTDLFLIIMQNFENNYILNYDPKSEEWEYLPDYVQIVANFMQFKTFKASEFYCLQRAVINMIKSFHQLPYLHYYLVIDGIVITCFYLKKTQYFDPFLENLIYQGVVWSCSHQHISNAEYSDEANKNLVTVKNFFPLWTGILKLSSNRTYDKHGLFLEDRKYILERIINQLIKTLMILINKLNMSVKLKEENITLTEPEKAYQLEQTYDHAIFLNVVDLYEEIFDNIEPRMFKKCICKMIKHILNKCINSPLISGFYKLLSYSLKIANKLNMFKDDNVDADAINVKETLRQFLEMLLDKMTQYKDELLIACLKVLLESPVTLIKDMLSICVVPFVAVFNIGRSYFPLAEMGLDTLNHWQDSLNGEEFDPFISKIIPYLDSYLRSKSLLGQTQSNVTEPRRKTAQVLKKRRVVLEMEPELMKLQRKVLTFIGKQSSNVCHAFVYSDELNEIVPTSIYGGNLHLKVTLPYEDVNVDIYLDVFVPRIVNLALYSSDRKTKITACELLQAIIMVFLGRAKTMSHAGLEELEDLLKAVSMPLLQLGCDIDQLVQQIFSPLVFQLIHWYASPSQLRGSHTAIVIDTLMEGITHPTNSGLRDFSGKCVKEFVKWTIKQISEEHLSSDPINIKILIKKMRFFSTHSDPTKKLGAALIFNNIYREMREEDSLINIFWFEILHIFVSSLSHIENNSVEDGNTIMQIRNALNHLERVIIEKPHVFRVSDGKRRIPSDINGGTLKDVAVWLLKQTGSNSKHCREASMNLFITVAPLTSNKNINPKSLVKEVFKSDFIGEVYENPLKMHSSLEGISHSEDCSVLFKWMQNLCCSLDGYNFVIKNNLCDIDFGNNTTFGVVNYFLENLQEADMAHALNLIDRRTWTFTTLDMEQFKKKKAECVLSVLKLFNTILLDEISLQKSTAIWNLNFWKLILNVIFYPQQLGLDNKVSQPKYFEILTVLLNNLPRKMPENITPLTDILYNFIQSKFSVNIDLKTNVTLLQRNIMNGLLLLNSTNISKQMNIEMNGLTSKLMGGFYSTLNENILYINDFPETTLEYCNLIFELLLTDVDELKVLINHLHGPYLVQSMEFSKEIKFGIFILNIFGDTIIPFLLSNFDVFLSLSIETKNLIVTVEIVMFILNYIAKNRSYKHYYENICKSLLDKWSHFKALFNSKLEFVHLGLEYVKLLFSVCSSVEVREVQHWLLNLLLQEEDLNNSLQIFYLLVGSVNDNKFESKAELEKALSNLFDKMTSVETERTNFLFDKMLSSIPHLKSTVIFKFLITCYEKLTTHIDVDTLLKQFMNNTDMHTQKSTLKAIYKTSKNVQTRFESSYKLIKNIIPPLFQSCHISCFEHFFVEHINEITVRLQSGDSLETNILDFVLVELLFLRIPLGTAQRTVCPISNAAKNPKLLNFFLKHTLEAFKKYSATSNEVLRLYKCHAYNALASIISNSVKSQQFYEKLFVRHEHDKDILWSGIIDTSINYEFPILFDSIPSQRKIIINIRDELRAQQKQNERKSKSLKYIESQKLFSSSLSEDVTHFDFTNTTLRTQKVDDEQNGNSSLNCQSEIQLDAVLINNHECMATICGLIQHIYDTGINELPQVEEEEIVLPNWMKSIRTTLLNIQTHRNIKLFLVKVIDNTINIFNYYAQSFLEPLLQFLVDKCAGDNLNYFVIDVVCILAKWSSIIKPNERERKLASEMLLFLISNLSNERTDVFKYNLDLIKLLVESWKEYIEVPSVKLFEILSSDVKCEIGIHLTSIFLVNNLQPWQDNKNDDFMALLLRRINSSKKSTYKSCAETIGLMVKFLNGQYGERVDTCLKTIGDFNKYVYCLEGLAIHFPQLINAYHISKLICSLNQFPDSQKIVHLKIILRRVEISQDILEEISDFKIVEWADLLESANLEIQIVTLKIIKTSLSSFMNYKVYPKIVDTLGRNITNSNALYRNCVYDIAILIYQENTDISDICKEILIFGLIDEDTDNKEKVTNFWKENSNIPNTLVERFSYLLSNLYKAKMEDHFLSYVNYFLITVLNTREEYNTELFEHPLEDCDFEDYRLQLNWRLQHPSVVPLFAETFADTERSEYDNADFFQLRETQPNLSFSKTQSLKDREFSKYTDLSSSLSINISDSDSSIKNPNDLVLSQKYRLSKGRFLKDKSKISIIAAHHETKKQIKKVERRKDLAKEREKKVTIYRNYRKGDFPDIQILLSSILEPLQMLSLQDGEVAKILLTEIFKAIILKIGNNDTFTQSVLDSIQHIFNNSTSFNPNLISTLLDILLTNKDRFHLDQPQLISYVCQQSGLLSIGTLLLEEYIISSDNLPSGSKKGTSIEEKETTYWVKLSELYKELEEWDTVRSIFLEKMNCKDTIQKAIQYESEGQWKTARELYVELIETDVSADRKDFYYDSYFKCFANLGEWEDLPKEIESVITTKSEDVWTRLWDKDWCQQKLLPWYIQAHIKNTLFTQKWPEEFSNNLNQCLNCAEKAEYIQTNFSEELCIMWLFKKDISSSSLYLNSYIKNFLGNWQLLNPMYQSLRYDKILQLRNIIEVDVFISIYKNLTDDFEETLGKLVGRWENAPNEILPSILLNETRALYRTLFVNTLKDKILKYGLIDVNQCIENIESAKTNINMSLIETAIELSNYYVSKKYLIKYATQENLKFKLAFGNVVLLRSEMMTDPIKKVHLLVEAAENFGSLFSISHDPSILLPANMKYFDIFNKISHVLTDNRALFPQVQKLLRSKFDTQFTSPEDINTYASNKLRLAVDNHEVSMECDDSESNSVIKHVANAYVKLAYFTKDRGDRSLQGDFILYVLRAMKLNSLEGKQLFPCILTQNRLDGNYTQLFIDETDKIPTWMFLGWIPQLLANLDSTKIFALSKIVTRIAETYPQAIMYPYRLSKEHYRFTDSGIANEAQSLTNKLDSLLLSDPMIDKFLKALSYVGVPTVILKYYVEKMYKSKEGTDLRNFQENVMNNIFDEAPNSKNINNMQGNMFKIIAKYKKIMEKILTAKKMKDDLIKMDADLKKPEGKPSSLLKDYCPWLANFSANKLNLELEIPGQYSGEKLPLPQHHIKISGFHPNVSVMKSLRKPIKLTIIGMDMKEYPFLIKFGEDIRQDQRIEQLFVLMNDIFKSDGTCNCNNHEILTYQVIPLTSNLGMIQWVTDTQSLNEFIKKSLSNREVKDLEKIGDDYSRWLYKNNSVVLSYGYSAIKYNRNKTIPFYRSLVNRIPSDVLRKSFCSLSSTTENYIALRNNFIKSYAVLCISHWILGIGDRHLDNSKICTRNGKVLGIDFGHAFGTATQILPVPELVPFRLTPHIVNLMEPLKERGPFRQIMIHTLRALRANHNSLLATMDVFVEEPSLDWLEHAKGEDAGEGTHDWYPNVKVGQTKRKLEGASSTKILVEDLKAGRKDPKCIEAYVKLVEGEMQFDKRAGFLNDNLSIEEQVDCLLDHAADYNLLGRMWCGWMPWV